MQWISFLHCTVGCTWSPAGASHRCCQCWELHQSHTSRQGADSWFSERFLAPIIDNNGPYIVVHLIQFFFFEYMDLSMLLSGYLSILLLCLHAETAKSDFRIGDFEKPSFVISRTSHFRDFFREFQRILVNYQGGVAQSRPWFQMIIWPNISQKGAFSIGLPFPAHAILTGYWTQRRCLTHLN